MKRVLLAAMLLLAACKDETANSGAVTFEFLHKSHDERFRASTSDADLIAKARAELQRPPEERMLHPNGALAAGDGGVNAPWSWHFVPSKWGLAEMSIELCDGWPSYVEDHVDEWLQNPGSFCPWSSRIAAEISD